MPCADAPEQHATALRPSLMPSPAQYKRVWHSVNGSRTGSATRGLAGPQRRFPTQDLLGASARQRQPCACPLRTGQRRSLRNRSKTRAMPPVSCAVASAPSGTALLPSSLPYSHILLILGLAFVYQDMTHIQGRLHSFSLFEPVLWFLLSAGPFSQALAMCAASCIRGIASIPKMRDARPQGESSRRNLAYARRMKQGRKARPQGAGCGPGELEASEAGRGE